MFFVPIVPHTPQAPPPSPAARQLAEELQAVVREYQRRNPAVTPGEIRQATDLVARSTGRGVPADRAQLGLAIGLGLMALVGVLFMLQANGTLPERPLPWTFVLIILGLVAAVAALFRRRP